MLVSCYTEHKKSTHDAHQQGTQDTHERRTPDGYQPKYDPNRNLPKGGYYPRQHYLEKVARIEHLERGSLREQTFEGFAACAGQIITSELKALEPRQARPTQRAR